MAKKGGDKAGKGCKKQKSEDGNGNIVQNTTQPNKFKLTTGESWKHNFSMVLPHNWPAWTDKIQMCARWHLKGNWYNNCSRAISHIRNNKIPDNTQAALLTFLTKCRKEIAKKKDWLLGSRPSSIRPPKKPPTSHSYSRWTRSSHPSRLQQHHPMTRSPMPSFCQESNLSQQFPTFWTSGLSTFPNENCKNKKNKHVVKQH